MLAVRGGIGSGHATLKSTGATGANERKSESGGESDESLINDPVDNKVNDTSKELKVQYPGSISSQ